MKKSYLLFYCFLVYTIVAAAIDYAGYPRNDFHSPRFIAGMIALAVMFVLMFFPKWFDVSLFLFFFAATIFLEFTPFSFHHVKFGLLFIQTPWLRPVPFLFLVVHLVLNWKTLKERMWD